MTAIKQTKPRLRQSMLRTLSACGVRFAYEYLERRQRPGTLALHRGTGAHAAIKADLREKIATAALLPDEAVSEAARDGVMAACEKEGVRLDDEERVLGLERARGHAVDVAVACALAYHRRVAPALNPTHVERRWVVETPYAYDLSGTIDVQEEIQSPQDPEEGPQRREARSREVPSAADEGGRRPGVLGAPLHAIRIRDTKTTGKSPARTDADTSEQLTMYALAARVLEGAIPAEVALDHLVSGNRGVKVVTQISRRTDEDLAMELRRVERAIEVIEKGRFAPADPSSWQCSARWCSFHDICPFAKAPVSVAVAGLQEEDDGEE